MYSKENKGNTAPELVGRDSFSCDESQLWEQLLAYSYAGYKKEQECDYKQNINQIADPCADRCLFLKKSAGHTDKPFIVYYYVNNHQSTQY